MKEIEKKSDFNKKEIIENLNENENCNSCKVNIILFHPYS
jgi:hypothetical protein